MIIHVTLPTNDEALLHRHLNTMIENGELHDGDTVLLTIEDQVLKPLVPTEELVLYNHRADYSYIDQLSKKYKGYERPYKYHK